MMRSISNSLEKLILSYGQDHDKVLYGHKLAQNLLQESEHVKSVALEHFGNRKKSWEIVTNENTYSLVHLPSPFNYERHLLASKIATELNVGLRLHSANSNDGTFLFEKIENQAPPSYEEDPEPYKQAMRNLRSFHLKGRQYIPDKLTPPEKFYNNFLKELKKDIPNEFLELTKQICELFQSSHDWFQSHATLIHGNFNQDHVFYSLDEEKKSWTASLANCNRATFGHPYIDIAKFAISLPNQAGLELLCAYLGQFPSVDEEKQYLLCRSALFLHIAINSLLHSETSREAGDQNYFNLEEMQRRLDAPLEKTSKATFNRYRFMAPTVKERQLRAIAALRDSRSAFDELISV